MFLLPLAFADSLSTFRADGFTQNVLSSVFPSSISIQLRAARPLSDNSLVVAGSVLYPPGFSKATLISNGPGFLTPENTTLARLSALVIKILSNGTVAWASRATLIKAGTEVSLAIDSSDNIYIAGCTTDIAESGWSPVEAPFMAKLDKDGQSSTLVAHKSVGQQYLSLSWHKMYPNVLLLASYAPESHEIFSGFERRPTKGGLVGVRVDAQTLAVQAAHPISISEGPTTANLVFDKFWDVCSSVSGERLYFAVRRQVVVNFTHSFTPSILAVSTAHLSVSVVRSLPKDLQLSMKVAADLSGLYAAYVSRIMNRETLVVRKLTLDLNDKPWQDGSEATFELPVTPDESYFRQVASSVTDINVDSTHIVRVLLHMSEIINRSDPLIEQHRQLSNGRPAVVEIAADRTVVRTEQSTASDKWTPRAIILGKKELFIAGTDEGRDNASQSMVTINPRPLLTGLELKAVVTPKPAGPSSTPDASPDPNRDVGNACLGVSSKFAGRPARDLIIERHDLRLQWHPLRKLVKFLGTVNTVEMLCIGWHNGTIMSSLCATPFHILRWHGRLMYMHELCDESKLCSKQTDEPLGFKGPCGADLVAHDFLNITMHSASNSKTTPVEATETECVARAKNHLWWLMLTM